MSRRLLAVVALALFVSCSSPSDALDDHEVVFLQDMYAHHEQAVRMALLVLPKDGASPITRSFATDVIASQRYEMGLMEGYLTVEGEERGAGASHHDMPGMASNEALSALADATGDDADARFLQLMIEHHRGGIAMAEEALDDASSPHVLALAERIRITQRLEIGDMEKAQDQLGLR